jgi:hypothetical protein
MSKVMKQIEAEWKTFIIAVIIILCSTWLLKTGVIDMPAWKEMIYAGGGLYGLRTVAGKFSPKKS